MSLQEIQRKHLMSAKETKGRSAKCTSVRKPTRTVRSRFGSKLKVTTANHEGLIRKYHITKADGRPCDPAAIYFVLRLDHKYPTEAAQDFSHIEASRAALRTYAEEIRFTLPQLADDLLKLLRHLESIKG